MHAIDWSAFMWPDFTRLNMCQDTLIYNGHGAVPGAPSFFSVEFGKILALGLSTLGLYLVRVSGKTVMIKTHLKKNLLG